MRNVNKIGQKSLLAVQFDKKKQQAIEIIESHNFLKIFFRLLVLILTKTSENCHHVWGSAIYRDT